MNFFYPTVASWKHSWYLVVLWVALILPGTTATAQDIETFVKQTTVPVRTISPDSSDYVDLEAFGNAIGDARIVMLGEQDHGDAPAFLAKTRLIRYLHEKKGFNVLAFESDFFSLNQGWDQADKSNLQFFFQGNIFPVWSLCSACSYLFKQYIPQTQATATPIQVSGFDMQLVLQFSNTFLTKKLDSLLQAHNLPITREPEYASKILPLVDSCKKSKLSRESMYDEQRNHLLRIRSELGTILSPTDFWLTVVDNLLAENIQHRPANDIHAVINYRDEQMARNLLWLATVKYSSEKIIVWAQNGHISRYGQFNDSWQNKLRYMGRVFDEIKPASLKTYSLGFASFEGEAGRVIGGKIFNVDKPRKNAYENWVPRSFEYAFTDFTTFRNTDPSARIEFRLKGLGHSYLQDGSEWHKLFDGLFFIRGMYSCIRKNP